MSFITVLNCGEFFTGSMTGSLAKKQHPVLDLIFFGKKLQVRKGLRRVSTVRIVSRQMEVFVNGFILVRKVLKFYGISFCFSWLVHSQKHESDGQILLQENVEVLHLSDADKFRIVSIGTFIIPHYEVIRRLNFMRPLFGLKMK